LTGERVGHIGDYIYALPVSRSGPIKKTE